MVKKSERQWLQKAIKKELIPAFKRLGFESFPLPDDSKNVRQMVIAYPFGILRRNSPRGVDIIDIELDQSGRVGVRFCFASVSSEGYKHPTAGHVPIEDIIVLISLKHYYEAYQYRILGRWFSLWHWPGRVIKEPDYEQLIRKIIEKIIPEIEEVFNSGKIGSHIREIKLITKYILKKDTKGRAIEYVEYDPDGRVVGKK